MLQLLKTEYKKFRYNSTVSLLFILFTVLFPTVILAGKSILKNPSPPFPSNNIFYEFPTVWEYQGYVGNWLVFFIMGFMVLHMFTSEVSYKTMRQNIIAGYTKKEYFISKMIVIVCLAVYATIIYTLSCLVLGMIHTTGFDMELVFDNNWASTRFFIMCMGYMCFAFLVANVLRSGGLSMFLYFAFALILEPIIKGAMLYYLKNSAMNYLPLNTIEDLMCMPLFRTSSDFLQTEAGVSVVNDLNVTIGLSIVYTVLFVVLAWVKFKKSDV
ncbi:MAG: ABC transporter permease [Saprospiraceae bacterium]|nr:ABC transporter permease [Saprospiraceae bacterium]